MNLRSLGNAYQQLTPKERFRLVFAAKGRKNRAEEDRVATSGGRISIEMPDYAPYQHALDELALLTFLEVQNASAEFREILDLAVDTDAPHGTDDERAAALRREQVLRASGYLLCNKVAAWRTFCDRWSIPPTMAWERLPGYDRFQRMLKLAEADAFSAREFVHWLNVIRPQDGPRFVENPRITEETADDIEDAFTQLCQYWCVR